MSPEETAARQAFRRIGERELECLHSTALQKPVEWVNYEDLKSLNNELGRLEDKRWWQGRADTEAFLWQVNDMRSAGGLPPLVLRANAFRGHRFEEVPCGSSERSCEGMEGAE